MSHSPMIVRLIKKEAVEIRRLWVKLSFLENGGAAEYVRELLGVPGCRCVIRLDKEVRRPGELSSLETRYYISSLDSDVVAAKEFRLLFLAITKKNDNLSTD